MLSVEKKRKEKIKRVGKKLTLFTLLCHIMGTIIVFYLIPAMTLPHSIDSKRQVRRADEAHRGD
eukprot:COSAG01_NODE_3185_length_6428_cov_3.036722_5_plen_64_part_00